MTCGSDSLVILAFPAISSRSCACQHGGAAERTCCALSTERVYHAGQYMLGSVQKSFRLLQLNDVLFVVLFLI
jgi:hypothetical protein